MASADRISRLSTSILFVALAAACGAGDDAATQSAGGTSPQAANAPPRISGSPPRSVLQNSQYSFTPTVNDPNNDPLAFSIANRPAWASFIAGTGQLQGTPTAAHVGTYTNITISVSDGTATAALPAFTIIVAAFGAGSTTLTWIAPTQNEDGSPLTNLASYRIYWGTASRNYTNSVTIDNPGLTTYVVDNLLTDTTYYFATTAGNSEGVFSAYSSEATRTIP